MRALGSGFLLFRFFNSAAAEQGSGDDCSETVLQLHEKIASAEKEAQTARGQRSPEKSTSFFFPFFNCATAAATAELAALLLVQQMNERKGEDGETHVHFDANLT